MNNLRWILPVIAGITAGVKTWGIVSNITAIATDLLAKKQAILNIAGKIFNKTAWSNPWVLVIGLIVGAIVALILHWDKLNNFLKKHSEIINRIIIPSIQGIIISLSVLTLWQKKTVIWNGIMATKTLFLSRWQVLTMGVAKAKIFLSTVMTILTKKVSLLTVAQKLFNVASKSNIMGIVITAIIVLLMILIKNWDKVKIKIDEIKQKFLEFKEYVMIIFTAFSEKFPLLAKTFEDIFGGIKKIFGGLIDFVTGIFTGNWEQALDGLKSIAKGIFDTIKGIFLAPFRLFATGINWVIEKINGLKIDVPDWIPVIGGNSYSFNIPTIPEGLPNFATGTSYHRGGPAIINEGGRGEIVDLPNGSKVIPSDKSEKLLDKNNNTINVTVNVYNPNNVDEIINKFAYKLKLAIDNS